MTMRARERKTMRGTVRAHAPACAAAATLAVGGIALQAMADVTVNVFFDADNCPIGVDKVFFEVAHPESVRWVSNPNNVQFAVFFHPFAGPPIKSNPQGETPPRQVSNHAPKGVIYKYTIAKPPTDPNDPPPCSLDPVFRVD